MPNGMLKNGNARSLATASGSSVLTLVVYLVLQASGLFGSRQVDAKSLSVQVRSIEQRLVSIERRLDTIDKRIANLDRQLSSMQARVDLLWRGSTK